MSSEKPTYMSLKAVIGNHMEALFGFMRYPFENRNYETPLWMPAQDSHENPYTLTNIYTGQYPGIMGSA